MKNQQELIEDGEQQSKWKYDMRRYMSIGIAVVITFSICIFLFFIIYRYSGVARIWDKMMTIMQPFIIGLALAYILNPVMMYVENKVSRILSTRMQNAKTARKTSRGIGILASILLMILVVIFLLELIIPQIIDSVQGVIVNTPDEINHFMDWLNKYLQEDSDLSNFLEQTIKDVTAFVGGWVEDHLFSQANQYIISITTGVVSAVKIITNIFVGIIISVYLLAGKERFIGQIKKLIYTIFNAKNGNIIVSTARKSNEIFGGFISGKIIDSIIIGLLCYIGLIILQMPYPILVSVIVGVTNVIPFFGPYIGAIPSFVIIALANPVKGLYFLIFILVLQQLDGNIIGPKILGDSTGLSPFWVVFSIIIAGGIFGFAGMLLGVPTFAVIYNIVGEIVSNRLARRELPQDTESYIKVESLDEDNNELKYLQDKQ